MRNYLSQLLHCLIQGKPPRLLNYMNAKHTITLHTAFIK